MRSSGNLYAIRAGDSDHVKIGFTRGEPTRRLAALQTGSPLPLRIVALASAGFAFEAKLHELLAARDLHVSGEWFALPLSFDSALINIFAAIDLFESAATDEEKYVVVGLVQELVDRKEAVA